MRGCLFVGSHALVSRISKIHVLVCVRASAFETTVDRTRWTSSETRRALAVCAVASHSWAQCHPIPSVSEALHERVLAELNYTKAEFTMLCAAVC